MDQNWYAAGGDAPSHRPLNASDFNLTNFYQATEFLALLLNDDELKLIGYRHAAYFWYGIFAAIGIASLFHWTRWLTLKMRLRQAAQKRSYPAKPKMFLMRWFATFTAMSREISYAQTTPTKRILWLRVPPVGTIFLILAHFIFIIVLEAAGTNVPGAQYWQAKGVRAGHLAAAQIPLLILLVGKNNLVTLVTGVSHERLNVLHRWTARFVLLMSVLHCVFQNKGWDLYHMKNLEWWLDECPKTGLGALVLLAWINISNMPFFRRWGYEVFVLHHLATFMAFIVIVAIHIPLDLMRVYYIYIGVALYIIDRVIRTASFAWKNARPSRATLTPLEGGVTKIRLTNPKFKSWNPGSYVLLSIPRFGKVQVHPATIASTPKSHNGDLIFLLKSHKGLTKRIWGSTDVTVAAVMPHMPDKENFVAAPQSSTHTALLQGPFGGAPYDFAAFNSVVLFAGGAGITFTLAFLEDLAEKASTGNLLPLRHVTFVWCIKEASWTSWVGTEIAASFAALKRAGIDVNVSIYLTDTEKFPTEECMSPACRCDTSAGPCVCHGLKGPKQRHMEEEEERAPSDSGSSGFSPYLMVGPDNSSAASTLPMLPCALFWRGRVLPHPVLSRSLENADGETAVAVCGPIGMNKAVRNTVVRLSDERAIHKGTGAQGCFLHVESFT